MTESHENRERAGLQLELERDIRLRPHQLELGRLELLTDSLRLPFEDIERDLGTLALDPSEQHRLTVRRSIKRYLGRLNANPLLPLRFRLKVLRTFERHLDLFDAEISAMVLNAYKIGILLVQDAARGSRVFLAPLLELIADAVVLAERLLAETLARHRLPDVIEMRQALDLIRLGLVIAEDHEAVAREQARRLQRASAAHELLRFLCLHAFEADHQREIRKEVHHRINAVPIRFVPRGMELPRLPHVYLVTRLGKPNERPEKATRLPERADQDLLLLSIGEFTRLLNEDYRKAMALHRGAGSDHRAWMTERRQAEILQRGRAIQRILQTVKRRHPRKRLPAVHARVEVDAASALGLAVRGSGSLVAADSPDRRRAWSLVDISRTGACFEKLQTDDWGGIRCGHLVGLAWEGAPDPLPMLGFVRWRLAPNANTLRFGLEFLEPGWTPVPCVLIGNWPSGLPRRCTLLFDQEAPMRMLFPHRDVQAGMRLIRPFDGDGLRASIATVEWRGENCSYGTIRLDEDQSQAIRI